MAIMLEQLDLRPGQRVLEIGAGTGYNAALIAHVVGETGRVTTIDLDDDIVASARVHLAAAGVTGVRVVCADGWAGCAEDAPFDRIILTVGAHDISPAWRAQRRPGGRLVLPLALPSVQASVAFAERGGALESLRTPGKSLSTGLVAHARELYAELIAWVGLREPTSGWFVAQGEAMATNLVPPFVGDGKEARATYGLFEPGGVALFVREATPAEGADGGVSIGIRVHGDAALGERLRRNALAWSDAGRPDLQRLRIHACPIESPGEPGPQQFVLTRPHTRLVLEWMPAARE